MGAEIDFKRDYWAEARGFKSCIKISDFKNKPCQKCGKEQKKEEFYWCDIGSFAYARDNNLYENCRNKNRIYNGNLNHFCSNCIKEHGIAHIFELKTQKKIFELIYAIAFEDGYIAAFSDVNNGEFFEKLDEDAIKHWLY